jgi:hypothetical protein
LLVPAGVRPQGHPYCLPDTCCHRLVLLLPQVDYDETVFLLAGYDKYQRPYVWVRPLLCRLSPWPWHPPLARDPGCLLTPPPRRCLQLRSASPALSLSESAEDMPLSLETTESWPHADPPVTIWEIVAELISLCVTGPTPDNPFEMEVGTLDGAWAGPPPDADADSPERGGGGAAATAAEPALELTELERALNYGAVAGLLHEIFLSNAPYAPLGKSSTIAPTCYSSC